MSLSSREQSRAEFTGNHGHRHRPRIMPALSPFAIRESRPRPACSPTPSKSCASCLPAWRQRRLFRRNQALDRRAAARDAALHQAALADNLAGLANYPTTQGTMPAPGHRRLDRAPLRRAGARCGDPGAAGEWLARGAVRLRPDRDRPQPAGAKVVCPNPFYQIYEGAALLAGAQPMYLNTLPHNDFAMDWANCPRPPGATCNWSMSARRATRPAR
jgi:hypothetical protein